MHDSHFYVNVRPRVKSSKVTYTQSKRVSLYVFASATLVHAGSLFDCSNKSVAASFDHCDPPNLTPIRIAASHHDALSKMPHGNVSFLIYSIDLMLPVIFVLFFSPPGGDDDDSAADTEDELQR